MSQFLQFVDRPIAFQRSFVRLGAGVTGALLLSQLVYWQNRMDGEWFYKTQTELEDETGLTRYEQEGARKKLCASGVLEEDKRGIPAKLYFRVNEIVLMNLLLPGQFHNQGCGKPANRDVENQQAGMGNIPEPVCVNPASIPTVDYTETTHKIIDPSKSPVGRNGSHALREKLISLLEGKFNFSDAGELHDAVESEIVHAGFNCQREYPVADRGDGRRGRVDLFVTDKNGGQCGIEIDRINARDKSAIKLKQLKDGFILIRDGVLTERYEFNGIPVIAAHPATADDGYIARERIFADAQKALEFYNQQTGTRCRDAKPFVTLLTPTTSRDA